MYIVPNDVARTLLALWTATDAPLNGVLVKLFQNDYVPTRGTVLADLTVATFTGYATSSAVVWGAPFTNTAGLAEVIGGIKQFTASGSAVANTIYGYYVTSADGADLIYVERFEQPVGVAQVGDVVLVYPRFVYDGSGVGQP